jgi:hypothetical protein
MGSALALQRTRAALAANPFTLLHESQGKMTCWTWTPEDNPRSAKQQCNPGPACACNAAAMCPAAHLVSACTSMLSSVRPCPLPGTRRRKPLWLTGVAASVPPAGEGGVICEVQRARLRAASAGAAAASYGSTAALMLRCLQAVEFMHCLTLQDEQQKTRPWSGQSRVHLLHGRYCGVGRGLRRGGFRDGRHLRRSGCRRRRGGRRQLEGAGRRLLPAQRHIIHCSGRSYHALCQQDLLQGPPKDLFH